MRRFIDGDIKEWSLEKDDGKLILQYRFEKGNKNKKLLLMLRTVKVLKRARSLKDSLH